MFIKKIFRTTSRFFGYEITRYQKPPISPLLSLNIDLLIDIGANTGQSAIQARSEGYFGKIILF